MKSRVTYLNNQLVIRLLLLMALIAIPGCGVLDSMFGGVKSVELMEGSFSVSIGGGEVNFLIRTPDQGNLSGISVQLLDLRDGKIVVISDENKIYLPEIRILTEASDGEHRIMLKLAEFSHYAVHTTGQIDLEKLKGEKIKEGPLVELNAMAGSMRAVKFGLIIDVPADFTSETGMGIYATPFEGLFLAAPEQPSESDADHFTAVITFNERPFLPSLVQLLRERNIGVSVANLIGLTPEDILDLQTQAGSIPKDAAVFESQFGESNLENRLTKSQAANIFRYINSVEIVSGPCGTPEYEGKIYAMDPVPGESIVPSGEHVTLYYCETLSEEELQVVNLQFAPAASDCTFSGEVKPLDVVLVLDVSGSMQGSKLAVSKASAINFIKKMDPNRVRLGLVSFTSKAQVHHGLTDDYQAVIDTIAGFAASDGTAIDAGLDSGYSVLEDDSNQNNTPIILLLSDGYSDYDAAVKAAETVKAEGVTILTVGIGAADQGLLSSVASTPDDFIFSNTNQGLREVFSVTALRLLSGGHVMARDVAVRFRVNTDQFALIDSMLTNNGGVDSYGVVEWQIPVLYEGQELTLPVTLRPLGGGGAAYGTMEIEYGKCTDGPAAVLGPLEIGSEGDRGNASSIWSREIIRTGNEKTGTLSGFDSSGWLMDLGKAGVYSVVINGAGSELPPEIFVGNGREYLYPLYSVQADEGKVNVFHISDPKVYWLYIQSNSLSDKGEYSVDIQPGETFIPPKLEVDGREVSVSLDAAQESVYAIEGVGEGDRLTLNLMSDGYAPYPSIVGLDGESSSNLYEISGDVDSYVFIARGKGPYRLVSENTYDELTTYDLDAARGDRLGEDQGELAPGQKINASIAPQKVDLWKFTGRMGEGIKVALKIENPQKYEGISYAIMGPEWNEIAWVDVESESSTLLRLPQDGLYTLALQHDYGGIDNETGYELSLEAVSLPQAALTSISDGETVTGSLVQGQEDNWIFKAEANDVLTVKATCADPEASLYLRILDPSGAHYLYTSGSPGKAQLGPIRLPAGGEYTILVGGSASGEQTYDLVFNLE